MGQQAVHSLTMGCIYALLAVGLTCIYGAQRSLSLAYGGLYALGGYTAWWMIRSGASLWITFGTAICLCAMVGCLLHGLWRYRQGGTSEYAALLMGLGVLICAQEAYRFSIRSYSMKVIAIDSHQIYTIGPLMVTEVHWLVFGCTFTLLMVIQGVVSHSHTGATVSQLLRQAPATSYVNPALRRWQWLASGLGAMLAGISGVLTSLYVNAVYPAMGTDIMYKVLVFVLIGSLGSVRGALLVAFGFALLEGVGLHALGLPIPATALLLLALAIVGLCAPRGVDARTAYRNEVPTTPAAITIARERVWVRDC